MQNFLLSEWALTLAIWLSIPGGGHRCLSGQDGVIFNHKNPGRVPFGKGICRQLCLLTTPSAIYGTGKEILSVNFRTPKVQFCIKVSRSQNMKQKIYEILTSPKIQTNGVILNNCIDYIRYVYVLTDRCC